jgi:predicted dehydrogenase
MASIGVNGKGSSDSSDAGNGGEMVAICDVDEKSLGKASEKWPQAQKFFDFREMIEKMHSKIDAVTVSTPDHCHAAAAIMAMRMGKHCFCQKPLTHTIYEARLMGKVAKEMKVATQMGNQGTSQDGLRQAAASLKAGVIGTVKEVHVWTNRPIWAQGGPRPAEEPVPETLKWDLWLGPAPVRPYGSGYHPFSWRGWWDFGTGALGDMACHTVNMPFAGLGLRDPVSVIATTSGHNKDSYPAWSKIEFQFPATDKRPAVKLFWYDGGQRPADEILVNVNEFKRAKKEKEEAAAAKTAKKGGKKVVKKSRGDSGCLIIGEKGQLYSPDDYGAKYELFGGATQPEVEFVKSPGHFAEWLEAIRGGKPAMSNFTDYAGPLTETILLGNLAVWLAPEAEQPGKRVEWDAKNLKALNAPEVAHVIQAEYRKGYSL